MLVVTIPPERSAIMKVVYGVQVDLQLKTKTGGHKYFIPILNERATKNHPGGNNNNEDETQSVMMAWPANLRCPVTCLEKYLAKREPQCDALWQKPKNHNASSFSSTDI